jgi:hypothetical protein
MGWQATHEATLYHRSGSGNFSSCWLRRGRHLSYPERDLQGELADGDRRRGRTYRSRPGRDPYATADRGAYDGANCQANSAANPSSNTSADASPYPSPDESAFHVRRARESVGIQLLWRQRDLLAALEHL